MLPQIPHAPTHDCAPCSNRFHQLFIFFFFRFFPDLIFFFSHFLSPKSDLQSISDSTTISLLAVLARISDGQFAANCTTDSAPELDRRVHFCKVRFPKTYS